VKTHKRKPAPPFMISVVQEFLEVLYWKLSRVLDREGMSMLQWAFMMRALDWPDGVSFSQIMEVTGESKDNVRRAAASLKGFAEVVANPEDRRARKLVLTKRGRRRSHLIMTRFEQEMLNLLGARESFSRRAEEFKELLWNASAYLAPGDTADEKTIARSEENRELIPDNSLQFVEVPQSESVFTNEELTED